MGELDDRLDEWGRSETPPVDGAFVNRLDASLREHMHEREEQPGPLAWLFRPGVLAVGAILLLSGLVIGLGRSGDELGVANDEMTTLAPVTNAPSSSSSTTAPGTAAPGTTAPGTTAPGTTASSSDVSPSTVSTDADSQTSTTLPSDTTATSEGATTVASTTPGSTAENVPPLPITELSAQRNGRQISVSWRVDATGTSVAGWVLLAVVDGEIDVLEVSRDPSTRSFVVTIPDIEADYRLEGRSAEGDVVFDSGEILFSPDE